MQKIIGARKGCWNAENGQKVVEEVKKCKRLKFDSISLIDEGTVDKKKFNLKKKSLKSDVFGFN